MNINDEEKDQWMVTSATTEREGTRVVTTTREDTGSEKRGCNCISLLCYTKLPFVYLFARYWISNRPSTLDPK